MSFAVDYRIKQFFFDRQAIRQRLARGARQALGRAGAFVRRRARTSIRRRRGVSPPGSPPYAHSTDPVLTLKNILFGYDPGSDSVLVGPVKLNQLNYLGGQLTAGAVPALHEFGGHFGIREKRVGQHWRSIGRRRPRSGQPTRVRTARYAARPYMRPALEAEAANFPTLFFNAMAA